MPKRNGKIINPYTNTPINDIVSIDSQLNLPISESTGYPIDIASNTFIDPVSMQPISVEEMPKDEEGNIINPYTKRS